MSKVMLITGAGRGIGAATARLAAQRSYAVAVNYRSDEAAAASVVADIEAAGGRAIAIRADVAVEADILAMFETVDRELGRLDVLVNNAGVVDQVCRVEDMDAERIDRMMRINVTGPFICAREAIKRMAKRHGGQGGAIVNVGSAASHLGGADEYVDYAASKGAIDTMTEGLSKEVAGDGIRVNTVRPGVVRTTIHASGGNPEKTDVAGSVIPMGRIGEPEEIAEGVLWLAEAGFTTGALVDIDGGV
ncbi:SDR family oxidoreductase [Halomonas elongata]|uniref:Probable oxidoreductase YgfF (Short-chain dehydrogenase family) n=1 Tax=Halomonas elongata (strain ATCC 33173 / DSM 2581 / NBRC 15536 / NCIMB 2198 / 1H9) TaxID=768066 RepID=E1V5X7_HALED|nr:SDR family oxidoreductase [Halomonas elongata]WBF18478.1 SDR family oxidoreductase [Halomonas elongata]WPU47331.1 SDR family oxidoreductase [Halomonas elongata DSM 2581]CBV41239.1 probable oxidoreductase YgfF (short-chain dehydrogenase family) [Halomonas elongata DSM 2581]